MVCDQNGNFLTVKILKVLFKISVIFTLACKKVGSSKQVLFLGLQNSINIKNSWETWSVSHAFTTK